MRISEVVCSQDHPSPAASSDPQSLFQDLESLVAEAETQLTPSTLGPISAAVRRAISRLATLSPRHPLPDPSSKIRAWKLSFRLWNACVDLSNSSPADAAASEPHAVLRHSAADLLLLAGAPPGISSAPFKTASFFYKTGLLYHDLGRFDLAASCFEKATDITAEVQIDRVSDPDERKLLLDLNLARARTAWESSDRNLTVVLLSRSMKLLFGSPASYKALAEQYLHFGKLVLKSPDPSSAGKLINEALDLCEKGLRASGSSSDENLALEELKGRSLRFLAGERLQAKDYDGVLKCLRVLREGGGGGNETKHPSVGFIAMNAWIGMGKMAEAEKELMRMVVNKCIPESVCVSAAEVFLGAVGAEAAKGVLMCLVGRCRLEASSALRVVERVVAAAGGGRAKVVAELVSDERLVGLFTGKESAKERGAMHAVLWNYGAEHFRTKDYEVAAVIFENSMLYITGDEDSRSRRANCYRVLCLCHLGLAQLDRAQEFINEAEKYKILLQQGSEKEAISQIESMVTCIDFSPEYLTLSAHEAMASKSISAAIASLSILLNLFSPGKTMPMTEVALLRNIIKLLQQSPEDATDEIIKYTKRSRSRMTEAGVECFFGQGATGSRELNWFAANSWNMGLKAGKEKKFESSMEFWKMASDFYGELRKQSAENDALVCWTLILTVTAMIASEEDKGEALRDSDIKDAMEMLDRAGKLLSSTSISTSSMNLTSNQHQVERELPFLHIFNSYQIVSRLNDDPASRQFQMIKSFASSRACTKEYLLQLGLLASQGPRPNPEVASFTLNTCLTELLGSPSPDYQVVSLILRKLVGLAAFGREDNDRNGAYEVYRQAYRIIVGLKNDKYPVEEGKWLATTAWNRSGVAVRLDQVEVALKWMKMGLDLARHFPGMDGYTSGMEECLANFEKVSGDGGPRDDTCPKN